VAPVFWHRRQPAIRIPMCCYYTTMRPGGYRVYFDEFDSMWCCTGTGQPTALAGQHFMVYAPDL
jgi:hypothetical protein